MARSRTRLALAVFGAALLPALVACNALVGLSDFDKRECDGKDPCPFDAGGDRATDQFVPDGGADADTGTPAKGAGPVSWAAFPMPNYKDDAGITPKGNQSIAYEVQGDGTIMDTVTGRVWQKSPAQGSANLTFDNAVKACADIAPQGTWRLPKRIELVTLLSYGRANLFIDDATFSAGNVRAWTSSEKRPFVPTAPVYWIVDFGRGVVEPQEAKSNLFAVALCVKGQ